MHSRIHALGFSAVLATSVVITGCGGSGGGAASVSYSGSTAPAAITATNASDIGTTSGEAAVEAVSTDSANEANPFAVSINTSLTTNLLSDLIAAITAPSSVANLPVGVTLTSTDLGPGFCGGSVTVPNSFGQSSTLNGSITLNALCYDDPIYGEVTLSGAIVFSQTGNQITTTYQNLTVVSSQGTSTLNASITCDEFFITCSFQSDFVGLDGSTHRISDYSVTNVSTDTYNVSATFLHETYGEVSITTTTPIVVGDLCFPYPDSGAIAFTSTNGSSGTVTFSNTPCAVSGTWNDGMSGSGSF